MNVHLRCKHTLHFTLLEIGSMLVPVRGCTILFSVIVQINDESAGVQNTVKDVDCRLQTSACGRIRLGKDMQLSEILTLENKSLK